MKDANLEKLKEREDWYKLVVKIISWSDEVLSSSQINKISPKEWKNYYNGMIKTNVVSGKEKTTAKLKILKETIQKNGGFS